MARASLNVARASSICVGVTTSGLAYPLSDATLEQGPTRGLSNEMLGEEATVSVGSGRLAVVHTHRTQGDT